MPRRDGTGPIGTGSMTGRGFGLCTGNNAVRYRVGQGLGLRLTCRHGFGRDFAVNRAFSKTEKELLQEQKDILQNRLEDIDNQLENL